MKQTIITFLTDFGTEDGYAGSVKGRIKTLAPQVEIVDISHNINAFDIRCAAYAILNYSIEFAPGTIHLAVVDPTVGSQRKAIIIQANDRYFVGPDNGIFSLVFKKGECRAYEINSAKIDIDPIGNTFHARDVFGPAAAMIANGQLKKIKGPSIESIIEFEWGARQEAKNLFKLSVLTVDHFGNIITGLRKDDLVHLKSGPINKVIFKGMNFTNFHQYYAEQTPGNWLVLWNSLGFLEIAVSQGNAADIIQLDAKNDYIYIQTR